MEKYTTPSTTDQYTGLSEAERDCLRDCLKMEAECRSLWIRAMYFSPKLAAHCTRWSEFTPMDWAKLLADNAQFIDIAPLHKLGSAEWFLILSHQPALIEKCPITDEIPEKYWNALLKDYPWFKKYTIDQ